MSESTEIAQTCIQGAVAAAAGFWAIRRYRWPAAAEPDVQLTFDGAWWAPDGSEIEIRFHLSHSHRVVVSVGTWRWSPIDISAAHPFRAKSGLVEYDAAVPTESAPRPVVKLGEVVQEAVPLIGPGSEFHVRTFIALPNDDSPRTHIGIEAVFESIGWKKRVLGPWSSASEPNHSVGFVFAIPVPAGRPLPVKEPGSPGPGFDPPTE